MSDGSDLVNAGNIFTEKDCSDSRNINRTTPDSESSMSAVGADGPNL
jgi:hypothetical protein